MGEMGVSLFFTLSGFLITFLLLSEKKETGSISIKKFYARRILRIWPLYYLIIITGLFIIPHITFLEVPDTQNIHQNFFAKVVLYFLIFPNTAWAKFGRIPFVVQTWSIGVEEQFYLIWPWIITRLNHILAFLSAVYLLYLFYDIYASINYLQLSIYYNFSCISMGAIGGILFYRKQRHFLKIVHSHYIFLISLLAVFVLFFLKNDVFHLQEIFAILYTIIIVYLATAPHKIINLRWLDYLGKISYGIYMYNFIIIFLVLKILEKTHVATNSGYFHILSFVFSIPLIILISHLSYEYFEKKFLRIKKKFEVIQSAG